MLQNAGSVGECKTPRPGPQPRNAGVTPALFREAELSGANVDGSYDLDDALGNDPGWTPELEQLAEEYEEQCRKEKAIAHLMKADEFQGKAKSRRKKEKPKPPT